MAQTRRQRALFIQSIIAKIEVKEDHELVRLEKVLDWQELEAQARLIRSEKIKACCGPEPHYRQLLGAVALMAVKKMTFREAEDQIAHYAPARYLCGLMDSPWRPDHITIFDFTQRLGEDGIQMINTHVLKAAQAEGILDTTHLMSDTTAQEAKIPYPNEVGLMSRYVGIIKKACGKAGQAFSQVKAKVKEVEKKIKGLVRNSHLFAKTKEQKAKVGKKLYHITDEIHREVLKVLAAGGYGTRKADQEIVRITEVMKTLLPQIRHFLDTGFVASKKIIHLKMSELYAIVRGKAGKSVEFGLKWGINRIGGGFVQGFLLDHGEHASDKKFCFEAICLHRDTFGEVPQIYGFDRGGYSQQNIRKAKLLGVKHVGIAPTGKVRWAVSDSMAERIKRERAQTEGCIGTVKGARYGFNKPDARSTQAMETYGHRAILGFNMRKLLREQMKIQMATA